MSLLNIFIRVCIILCFLSYVFVVRLYTCMSLFVYCSYFCEFVMSGPLLSIMKLCTLLLCLLSMYVIIILLALFPHSSTNGNNMLI